MAISPIALALEGTRRELAQDDSYYKKMMYYFELQLPDFVALDVVGQFFFPLMVNPGSYSMEEPFTLEETPTQGGGLYIEENGIVRRVIRLAGHTGFKPRKLVGVNVTPLSASTPDSRSFSRGLPEIVAADISGQRHFQYLQDAVFRTYADYKRDPSTAEDTYMVFHNPKDQEHWLVAPMNFKLERDKDRPTLWNYDIQLLVLGRAEDAKQDFSEDKPLLDTIKDGLRYIKTGIDLAAGALNDITAIVADIESVVNDVGKIIGGVATVLDSATSLVEGVSSLIQSPLALLNQTNQVIEASMRANDALFRASDDIQALPANVKQKFEQMAEGLDRIGTHPDKFEKSAKEKLKENKAQQNALKSSDPAGAAATPTSTRASSSLGTANTAGDILSARSQLNVGGRVFNYTGAKRVFIGKGDTLTNLAAKYMGDARLWQHIAVLNDLKPPFLIEQANADLSSEEAIATGVLGLGDSILIPTFAKAPKALPLLPVLGVRSELSAEEHLLGTDVALEIAGGRDGAPQYDIPIDTERGSVDVKVVRGVPNMAQSVMIRLRTERGTDTMYRSLGMNRVIGFNILPVDLELARFRFAEAILQDPRVASVRRLTFDTDQGDALVVDADVELRGFTESATVKAKL